MSFVTFAQIFSATLFGSLLTLNAINVGLRLAGRHEQARRFCESVYPFVSFLELPSR